MRALEDNEHRAIVGVGPALTAALAQWLRVRLQRPVLLITPDAESAERMFVNARTLNGEHVALFSALEYEQDDLLPNQSVNLERLATLTGLREDRIDVVVAPWRAVIQDVPPPMDFSAQLLRIRQGESRDLVELLQQLFERGYERTEMVEFPGDCSARGGIVDVFPVTSDAPVRIEFNGDEICSLRRFDVHSQRSAAHEELTELDLAPARESCVAGAEAPAQIFDYFARPPLVVWHEFRRTLDAVARADEPTSAPATLRYGTRFDAILARGAELATVFAQELPTDAPDRLADAALTVAGEAYVRDARLADIADARQLRPHEYATQALLRQLSAWRARAFAVTIMCVNDAERERIRQILVEDHGVPVDAVTLRVGQLTEGWILPDCRHAVITDDEIFGRLYTRRRRRHAQRGRAAPIENIASVNVGEFVVHVNHGIGRFEGIRTVDTGDAQREMVVVRYADDALLYVPLDQAHLLERYIAVGEGTPVCDTLGSGRWMARRRRVEHAVLDMAAELLECQARREAQPGIAHAADNDWQRSFEQSFPYAPTPDQARAIVEVKQDMEASRPMDRLICGDVGFGKTEVAMRAAFKAVMSGRQVAVLVPTTLLAQQHFQTFSERMPAYPVRIAMLSRFVAAREQKSVVQDVAAGQIDIVIGTHRLLTNDVKVPNLGLVIVDEEQRFGVRQKERLKAMRAMVDVLSLSATPIPRTLYQSLTGARDMSTIMTPPEERLPVKTSLIKRDLRLIREAIQREIARGGQVFFLHNKVETIGRTTDTLRSLMPTVRFVTAHGQMPENDLAQTMRDFVARTHDVLVCTSIVESGLDMPNVNTIIIDNAQTFGLADLYQLRGRVGRAGRQAYAYLVIPADLSLDGAARHRLKAILDNAALGSGYAIAMKDLEIRGAGNLLGPQQSGHIAAVGFGLYCKLLQRAVQLLKSGGLQRLMVEQTPTAEEETPAPRYDWRKELPAWKPAGHGVELHLPFAGNIPEDYVESPALRLDLFRRIGQATQVKQLRALEDELRDRFGQLPESVAVMLRTEEVRLHARYRGIDFIEIVEGKVVLRRRGEIVNPTRVFPRIKGLAPLTALDAILAELQRMPSHGSAARSGTGA